MVKSNDVVKISYSMFAALAQEHRVLENITIVDSEEDSTFINANMHSKEFKNVSFSGIVFDSFIFSECSFVECRFFGCSFKNTRFKGCSMLDVFIEALSGSLIMANTSINRVSVFNTTLTLDIRDCVLHDCEVHGSQFIIASISGSAVTYCDIGETDILSGSIHDVTIVECSINTVRISSQLLYACTISRLSMRNSNLSDIRLDSSRVVDCSSRGSEFKGILLISSMAINNKIKSDGRVNTEESVIL